MKNHAPPPAPSATCRVAGLLQCRNEWGLLALSVSHALLHHVDVLYVMNDRSSDESAQGLDRLQEAWGDRLRLVHMPEGGFDQVAKINTLFHLARASSPDWIYTLDADEFLLTRDGRGLAEMLEEMPPECEVVQYEVSNFVAPRDFSECHGPGYLRIRHEAIPDPRSLRVRECDRQEAVIEGRFTFFSFPFHPKVIFRNRESVVISPGAHSVSCGPKHPGGILRTEWCYAAHLSWLSWERMERKVEIGLDHTQQGMPRQYGWQNQLVYRMARAGRLMELWERHSIPAQGPVPGGLDMRQNPDFARSIAATLEFLRQAGFDPEDLSKWRGQPLERGVAAPSMIPVQTLLMHVRSRIAIQAPAPSPRKPGFVRRFQRSIRKRIDRLKKLLRPQRSGGMNGYADRSRLAASKSSHPELRAPRDSV